jgi:ribosome biogenesis GTPase
MTHESILDQEQWFYRDENKQLRKERRIAQKTDRSKYRKSDLDAKEKQEESQKRQSLYKGRVLEIRAGDIFVFCLESPNSDEKGQTLHCHIKGTFKSQRQKTKNLVAVGDHVHFDYDTSHNKGQITFIEPRHSILSRGDNLNHSKEQILATNVELLIISFSLFKPTLSPTLIDRFLIVAKRGQMKPILVITKNDLFEDASISESVKEEELKKRDFILKTYRALGLEVILWQKEDLQALEKLEALIGSQTCVFSGPSGVGKSTLISLLTGQNQRSLPVCGKTGLGSHATTHAKIIPLKAGGWCVDTPGIRSLALWEVDLDSVHDYFEEIAREGAFCQFRDCKHLDEPGCHVKDAVEKGLIACQRYESYLNLIQEMQQEHRRR